MDGETDVAAVAALLAEPARARMLLALDERALPASVLAAEAGVAASTASGHLGRLVRAGFLDVEQRGRHRYYRLATHEHAALLESLARLAPMRPVTSLREGTRAHALRHARTCYDHLAGRLGTALMASLLARGWLGGGEDEYRLTPEGLCGLRAFGVDAEALPGSRRLIGHCVDWSEQRHHLAGKLGAALLARTLELDWVRRAESHRALTVTDAGRAGFDRVFGVVLS